MTDPRTPASTQMFSAFAARGDVAGVAVFAGKALESTILALRAIRAGDAASADEAIIGAELSLIQLSDLFDTLAGYPGEA